MNEYDSARMGDLLNESHGMEQTQNAEEADVLLLNTCSIREKAQEKVFHQLGDGKPSKQSDPMSLLGSVAASPAKRVRPSASERPTSISFLDRKRCTDFRDARR